MNPEQGDIGKSKFTPFLTAEKIQGANHGLRRHFPDNLLFPPRRLFRTPHQIFRVKIWPGWVSVKSESFFKTIFDCFEIYPTLLGWEGMGYNAGIIPVPRVSYGTGGWVDLHVVCRDRMY